MRRQLLLGLWSFTFLLAIGAVGLGERLVLRSSLLAAETATLGEMLMSESDPSELSF